LLGPHFYYQAFYRCQQLVIHRLTTGLTPGFWGCIRLFGGYSSHSNGSFTAFSGPIKPSIGTM
jgi:hypothetical protein